MGVHPTDSVALLLGHPVAHSLSPQVMGALAEISGLGLRYELKDIAPNDLVTALEEIRHLPGLVGLNFTLPHKEKAFSLADSVDTSASAVGAANVWAKSSSGFRAHNTDGAGLVWALKAEGVSLEGVDVLLVGAGGASRGISQALLDAKVRKIWIWNRTRSRSEAITRIDPQRIFALNDPKALTIRNAPPLLCVHTTSLGLSDRDTSLLYALLSPLRPFLKGALAADIVYRPETENTVFLEAARSWGARPYSAGRAMLICQAVLAFNLWMGSSLAPPKVLPEILRKVF